MPQDAPKHLCCPITHELLKEPVVAADGHTYEKSAIEQHFRTKITSPLTNEVLDHKNLVHNKLVKSQCIEWREKQNKNNTDIDALWVKCIKANKPKEIIKIISQMVDLVTQSDFCILQMSRLNKLKPVFIHTKCFTNEVGSAFNTLHVLCIEKHHKGVEEVSRINQMRKVTEESVVVLESEIEEEVKVEKTAYEEAKRKLPTAQEAFEVAKKRFEDAKANLNMINSAISDSKKIYDEAVEAQKEKVGCLNGLKKLTKSFKEQETKLSSTLDPIDDIVDENVPPTVSNNSSSSSSSSSSSGKRLFQKANSSSSSSAVKHQKIENKGAQNLFELGYAKYYGMDFQNRDEENGQRMIRSAAIAGFPMAIAYCTHHGWNGYKTDKKRAFKIFMDNSDYSYAQFYIGYCYQQGHGVAQDKKEAIKWLTKSANIGNSEAQERLGDSYFHGRGVAKDKNEAKKWWTKSANLGSIPSQQKLALYFS